MSPTEETLRDRDRPAFPLRGTGLVRLSLLLAVVFEVVPIEMDIVCGLWLAGAIHYAMSVKILCTTAILLPLLVYSLLNGPKALWCVKWPIIIVALIVTSHWYFYFSGKP